MTELLFSPAIDCPRNSHYEACTAACPATCVNPMAPASCSLPCVEGCVCDSGYLLYNDGCVPSSQCGCWHNGKHYPVGAEFWTDDTCSSKCRCPSQGSKVTCSNAACPADHYCGVQNGKPGCYPETYGICRVHNDPHYNTFDRETHHFMGICTYTLAKVCANSSSLPYFNVEAKNEHRGNPTVSYVQKVLVEVYGQHIEILRNRPSQVLVNEVLMTLPVSAAGGSIRVSRSGRYVTLETDFRLRVSYDTDHSVEVKVPTTYFNRTCGMCGNFNGRRQDDYMMPDGQQAKNSNELGNSWRVMDDDPSCGGILPPDPCPADQENLYRTERFCGMLTQRPGPFAVCHSVINPESIFESCVYDLCALNGSEELLCSALATYADACQEAGVTLPFWRNATFCAPTCSAPNSHYEPCMTACPATCLDRLAPENCSKPCVEGCACNSGFVLSGSACVPEAKCGCVFQDIYYSEGERVVTENCTSRCECLGNGIMTCSELSCGPDEICKIQNGLRGCYPAGTATCHIYGDPHYTTFDGKLHHFQGACNYTVVETCDNSSGSFRVTTRNEHRGSPSWTAINSVALTLDGVHIALRKNRIVYSNYNGDAKDDNLKPNGSIAGDSTELGESWLVAENNTICSPDQVLVCDPQLESEAREDTACGMITDPTGIFKDCHTKVAPEIFLENCVYDMCHTKEPTVSLCNGLQAYAESCTNAGICREWRNNTLCPISCPGGSQYKSCGSRCPSTCVTPSAFSPCSSLPVEGCFCNEGYVLSGDTCVLESRCGCVDGNNHYHQLGESWFTHHACTERCTCNSNNNITCTGWACGPLEICGVQDGELGCYPLGASTTSSPTTVGPSPSESTTVQGTSPASETTPPRPISTTGKSPTTAIPTTAEPCQTGRATCSASGDPHYYTFDGRVHHFMGNCTYTLSKVCNGSRGLPPFDVSTTNEHRGSNTKVSYVKSVHVDVYGTQISLLKNRKVTVNGTRRNLPVVIENKIKVQISGRYVLLETDFGLWVRFDGNHYVEVSVSGCYKGQLCGLCGNYNGDAKDDNLKPNGSIAGDSTELGESWLVAENNTICSPDQVLVCDPQLESEAREDTACGMITDPTGIFKDCHTKVAPEIFLENCVYDMCHTKEPTPISCPGGSQYKSCGSRCPSTCVTPSAFSPCSSLPVEGCFCNEGYVLSGDTCVLESRCGCVDGNNHYHQLGESWFTHHACTERCTCNSNNNITCTGWACGPLEICGVQDGELGCYPLGASTTSSPTTVGPSPSESTTVQGTSPASETTPPRPISTTGKSPTTAIPTTAEPCQTGRATCSASGDPHYYTFDGRVHHFMGNCTYTLSKVCNGSRGLPPFDVSTTNEHRGSNTKVSYVKSVHVDVYGTQISLLKNRKVTVNGTRRNLPVVIENKIKVQISGRYVLLETDFGLWVRFDGNHYVEVSVSGCYKGQLCGLCGNYNGDAKDDNLKPNGSIAGDSTELGESWLVAENNTICSPDQVLVCDPQLESEAREDTACGMITDPTGIFKDCHAKVAPENFLENCVYDMCHTKEQTVSLCNGLQAYAESCTNAGICREWRNNTLCPISCPGGSQYKSCGSRCPSTCVTPSAFSPCSSLPVEGCFCNEGYVLSGDTCVPESRCGCVDGNNHYHQLGESWFTHHACTERCTCNSNNNITCTAWACGELEKCSVQDGELGCYSP
ncbi:unnamed protein product, partial [Natator depressus]